MFSIKSNTPNERKQNEILNLSVEICGINLQLS